jgi:hypothetical protein
MEELCLFETVVKVKVKQSDDTPLEEQGEEDA